MLIAIFSWDGVYACARCRFVVSPFDDVMVSDVVCIIGILNLVSLS